MIATAESLRVLHRIHKQLADLRERLEAGPRRIAARNAMVAKLKQEQETAGEDLKAARLAADQKNLLLKTGEGKIEDCRVKLNGASNNREYQSFLEQIAASEMANSVLEDEILESLEKIEQLQVASKDRAEKVTSGEADLEKTKKVVADEEQVLMGEVQRLEVELTEAEKFLPADFIVEYKRIILSKGEDGMAAIEGDCCGGCFQQVTPNMSNELMLGRVIMCRSCGRLLYIAE